MLAESVSSSCANRLVLRSAARPARRDQRSRVVPRLCLAAFTLLALCGVCQAQEAAATLSSQTLIRWERASLDKMLVDPRDAALRRALSMVPARLRELPVETQEQLDSDTVKMIEVGIQTIVSPSRFAILYDPQSNAGGAFGYGVIASRIFETAAEAKLLSEAVVGIMADSGNALPSASKTYKGMRTTNVPGGKLSFGTHQNGSTYDVFFGTLPDNPAAALPALGKPSIEGLTPLIQGSFDFRALTPLANLMQMGVSQASNANGLVPPDLLGGFTKMNLVGDSAIRGGFEFGHTKDGLRGRVIVDGATQTLEALGLATARLSADDINIIPADATSASVSVVNTEMLMRGLRELQAQAKATSAANGGEPADPLGDFEQMTGVDIETDLLATLGGVGGLYASDSTGGGGILSFVAFIELKDRAKFISSHDKMVSAASKFLYSQDARAAKYVQLRAWSEEGIELFTLTPMGVPIPLEFTYAVGKRFLIAGLSPQGVLAAAKQASGRGDKGILSRTDLRLVDVTKQELLSFTFSDTARQVKKGYPFVSLAASAISNGVRAPLNRAQAGGVAPTIREPGMIMPAYNDFSRGIRPAISVSYRSEGRLLLESVSEGSLLVGAASVAGTLLDILPVLGAAAAGIADEARKGGMIGAASLEEQGTINLLSRGASMLVGTAGRHRSVVQGSEMLVRVLGGPSVWLTPEYAILKTASDLSGIPGSNAVLSH